jgi:uncharacterized membrane protein YoaK (UPF0700 family)
MVIFQLIQLKIDSCGRFFPFNPTGFATQFGADLARFRWLDALGMLLVPVFFLIGCMFSAFYVDREIRMERRPKYHVVFFFIFAFLLLTTLIGSRGWWGDFGADFHFGTDIFLIILLCLSSGLQNASISTASKRLVRTTHLTGLTTDLGIGIIRSWFFSDEFERNQNTVRILLIVSFILGSAAGSYVFLAFGYLGFGFAAGLTLALYLVTLKEFKRP